MSRITGLAPSVLRFWEREFPQLKPLKKGGQRLYSPKDIELVMKIKHLVYEKGFTLEGARKELFLLPRKRAVSLEIIHGLESIKEELQKIRELLEGEP